MWGGLARERLLQLIAERAGRLFDARGAIYVLRGDLLVPEGTTDASVLMDPIPMGRGVSGLCAVRRRGVVVNDYATRPEALPQGIALQLNRGMARPPIGG